MNLHIPTGLRVPDCLPVIETEGAFIVITVKSSHRPSLATTIERLIDMLDMMDGDENLEECGGAEPWLGWVGNGAGTQAHKKHFPHHLDLESDLGVPATYTGAGIQYDLEADGADDEPSMGSSTNGWRSDQTYWTEGCSAHWDECEAVSEDEGAQCDDEGAADYRL